VSGERTLTAFYQRLLPFASPPGGVWDRQGKPWTVGDVDGTKQAARLALPLSHVLVRLDGLYGNAAPLADLLAAGGPEPRHLEASLGVRLFSDG
jgi:hypothetical protein